MKMSVSGHWIDIHIPGWKLSLNHTESRLKT